MTVSMAPRNQKQQHRTLYLHVLGRGRKLKNSHNDLASLVRRSHVDLMTLARLPMSPPPSPTPSDNRSDTDDDDNASRISDWSMTPPLDVNTMARAASYSDIRDFFMMPGSNGTSRSPSVSSNLSDMTAPSPLEIFFSSNVSTSSRRRFFLVVTLVLVVVAVRGKTTKVALLLLLPVMMMMTMTTTTTMVLLRINKQFNS